MELLNLAHIQPEIIEAGYNIAFSFPTNINDEYAFPRLRFVPGQQVLVKIDGDIGIVAGIRLIFSRHKRRDGSEGTLRFPPYWEYSVKSPTAIGDGEWFKEDEIDFLLLIDEF